MKKTLFFLAICLFFIQNASISQISYISNPQNIIEEASSLAFEKGCDMPAFIKLQEGKEIDISQWQQWLGNTFNISSSMGFRHLNTEKDQMNEIHYRYIQTYQGIDISGNVLIVHTRNNKVYSVNGKMIRSLNIGYSPVLTEKDALTFALENTNASVYKWQVPAEEAMLKQMKDNTEATYYPKGELYFVQEKGNPQSQEYHLTYRFDIYSMEPYKREYVYVDAFTGDIILKSNRISTTDVTGTAQTKYSGTQTITTDSYSGSYRLRESGRGDGIETYNLATSTIYAYAVDFTDADNNWNNVNAQQDEVATDAHWGAEKTYDYYYTTFNRNSIDNNGFKLISYVHYNVAESNAHWDGGCMTYGDGDGIYCGPMTALDVCGHEISHGLNEHSANLYTADESGALNEGYADIFGICIEKFARPANWDWLLGADVGYIFRDIADLNAMGYADTYQGTNWDWGGEVHYNSGPLSYWFYIASLGGSGTNDNSDTYNITGITMENAVKVAYRTLTIYLTPYSTYADARFYSIIAATDLFGACSSEMETVTKAWYAVGVGNDTTCATGINPYYSESSISIYPNPSNGSLNMDIQTATKQPINFNIYDAIGNIIKSGIIAPATNEEKIMIDINSAGKGFYLLHLWNGEMNVTKKVGVE